MFPGTNKFSIERPLIAWTGRTRAAGLQGYRVTRPQTKYNLPQFPFPQKYRQLPNGSCLACYSTRNTWRPVFTHMHFAVEAGWDRQVLSHLCTPVYGGYAGFKSKLEQPQCCSSLHSTSHGPLCSLDHSATCSAHASKSLHCGCWKQGWLGANGL